MIVTPLYAGLLAILFFALSMRVIAMRGTGISLGDGGNPAMLRRIRGLTYLVMVVAGVLWAVLPAQADERGRELVPEVNAFVKVSETHRLYLSGSLMVESRANAVDGELGLHLDISIRPLLRRQLRDANWERERYSWVRVGYEHSDGVDGRNDATRERRLMAEITNRFELPMEVWLVGRGRVDLRDINGDSAQRYRLRLAVEREFAVGGMVMVPYAQAETLYDTRFNHWNRRIYQAGAEFAFTSQWRIETYIARQNDARSASANLDRVGLVLKYYR